jgi:hypothetical protein
VKGSYREGNCRVEHLHKNRTTTELDRHRFNYPPSFDVTGVTKIFFQQSTIEFEWAFWYTCDYVIEAIVDPWEELV